NPLKPESTAYTHVTRAVVRRAAETIVDAESDARGGNTAAGSEGFTTSQDRQAKQKPGNHFDRFHGQSASGSRVTPWHTNGPSFGSEPALSGTENSILQV